MPRPSFAERAFCAVCGSHLWMRDNTGKTYELMPGLFDEARDWPLRSEVYSDRAMAVGAAWAAITAGRRRPNMRRRTSMLREMRHDL